VEQWQSFWSSYRASTAAKEDDLFVQVGKTLNGQPIPQPIFRRMVEGIGRKLELKNGQFLLDLCCGNGLITFELARRVSNITAVDFTRHLIESACAFKAAPNIDYVCDDVLRPIAELVGGTRTPDVVLMNDSLAYFHPCGLATLLRNIMNARQSLPFRFLVTGIPDHARKQNFYNTPERMARHVQNETAGSVVNDGMGRWWHGDEIRDICAELGLAVDIEAQPVEVSAYRMDALIRASA
jgi:SAM-dependent methyltransferase